MYALVELGVFIIRLNAILKAVIIYELRVKFMIFQEIMIIWFYLYTSTFKWKHGNFSVLHWDLKIKYLGK